MELGKLAREYQQAVAVCEVDSVTLDVLGLKDGENVRVESLRGSVVVRIKLSRRMEPGVAFIPCGPYANAVLGSDTEETGMPDYKGVTCRLFPAIQDRILSPAELVARAMSGEIESG
jgi:formylmethanofuran dehydrogenase subunit D